MTGDKELLVDYEEQAGPAVFFGNNTYGQTEGYGAVTNGVVKFTHTGYVNGLKHNLLSVSQLCDADYKVSFDKHQGIIEDINGKVVLIAPTKNDVYLLDMTPVVPPREFCFIA